MAERRHKPKGISQEYQEAGIIKAAADTAQDALEWLDRNPEKKSGSYGHSIAMLAQVIASGEGVTPKQQIDDLKSGAEALIKKYGNHIVPFMRPELREALGIKTESK